jgi:hypothetical protein
MRCHPVTAPLIHPSAGVRSRRGAHIEIAVAEGQRRRDVHQSKAARLQTLAAKAEQFLIGQAQQNVTLEHKLAQLRAMVTDLS